MDQNPIPPGQPIPSSSISPVVELSPALIGFVDKERGALVALRDFGEEALFASADRKPLRWIRINTFNMDPRAILTGDKLEEYEG